MKKPLRIERDILLAAAAVVDKNSQDIEYALEELAACDYWDTSIIITTQQRNPRVDFGLTND